MTTEPADRPADSKSGMPSWLKRVIMFAILGAVLIIVFFILAEFLPRWWAERIGELSDRGFARGITWGLFFGGVCTLLPLLLVLRGGPDSAPARRPDHRRHRGLVWRSCSRCRI